MTERAPACCAQPTGDDSVTSIVTPCPLPGSPPCPPARVAAAPAPAPCCARAVPRKGLKYLPHHLGLCLIAAGASGGPRSLGRWPWSWLLCHTLRWCWGQQGAAWGCPRVWCSFLGLPGPSLWPCLHCLGCCWGVLLGFKAASGCPCTLEGVTFTPWLLPWPDPGALPSRSLHLAFGDASFGMGEARGSSPCPGEEQTEGTPHGNHPCGVPYPRHGGLLVVSQRVLCLRCLITGRPPSAGSRR